MLYFWILTVILFALAGRAGDAHLGPVSGGCPGMRDPLADHRLRTLFSGHRPHKPGRGNRLLMMLLGALIAATALLVRHCTGGHGQGYFHF